jgi:pimeloyl-ACP methyl ester carboxylesterase
VPALTRSAAVRTLNYNGAIQRYWDFPPVAGEGTTWHRTATIFMVHGFRGDHHGLLRIAEELPEHRVIIPDLPGFGASEALDRTHDVDAYAAFAAFSVQGLGLEGPTVLLGHSFGSVVAARAAAGNPELFTALVLVNPICEPALDGTSRLASALAGSYYRAAGRLPERAGMALLCNQGIVRLMSAFMAHTRDPGLRSYIHEEHRRHFSSFAERRVVLEAYTASVGATVRDDAARLAIPVLLVAAQEDDLGSVEGQRELAAMIPDARLDIIPGVGHLVHYEKPAEAARCIREYLSGGSDENIH